MDFDISSLFAKFAQLMTEVSAQNYSSETGSTCTGTGILCDAINSEADIYAIVIDGLAMNLKTARLLNCKYIYSGT